MITQAKKLLKTEGLTCVLINARETKTFSAPGIKHLIDWHTENPNVFRDAVIADTVIGLAAASILVFGGIKAVYGEIMSISAAELLQSHGVMFSYGKFVKNIMNRAKTDICPMERICLGLGPSDAFERLKAKVLDI